LPKAILNTVLVAIPVRAAQPVAQAAPPSVGTHAARQLNHGILIEPPRIPAHVNIIEERPLPPEAPLAGGPTGADSGVNLLNVAPVAVGVSRPPAPPNVARRVPVTSTIEAAKLISRVQPIYPPIAIQARIQGSVVLHAIISKEGGVSELQLLSGHPLLVNAALEAVRQWRYSPTLLSGQPVEVETTITVTFVLGQ
jgi:periplasmic protein TonB